MSASLSGVFSTQQFTDLGALGVGMRLYTYVPGTTTQKVAYTDAAATIPHTYTSDGAGGLYIALNARGELPAGLFLLSGGYDLALKTSAGASVWTRRAIGSTDESATLSADLAGTSDAAKGSGQVGFDPSLNYVAQTIGREAINQGPSLASFDGVALNVSSAAQRTANKNALIFAATISKKLSLPPGTFWIDGDIEVPADLNLTGAGRGVTFIKGDGDLFKITTSAFGLPVFRDFSIENDATRGKLFKTTVGADIGRVEFHNVDWGKSSYHIHSTDICVAWIIKGCRFNDATNFSRNYSAGLWAHVEVGNYTWFNGGGLFVAGSSQTCHIEGVFEYNTNDGISLLGDTTAGISDWTIACHFEGNGASGASDVTLATTVAARIRGINFLGSTFILPNVAQTERVTINAGGGGSIGAVGFVAGSCYGTKPLATNVGSVYVHPTFWLDAITPLANQQIPFAPPYQFSGNLGSVTVTGPEGGNGVVQASIVPPVGTKWASVYVQGNSYNGVANSHDGRLYGNYRASGNRTTADVDVNNSAGANQGWVLSWTGSAIQIANKAGMSNPQSGDTTMVFYG